MVKRKGGEGGVRERVMEEGEESDEEGMNK